MYTEVLRKAAEEGEDFDVDTYITHPEKYQRVKQRSSAEDETKDKPRKRQRTDISDDAGEGTSSGTRIHIGDISRGAHGSGGAGTHDSLEQRNVPGTRKYLNNTSTPIWEEFDGAGAPRAPGEDSDSD
jgi:hypothetical protein